MGPAELSIVRPLSQCVYPARNVPFERGLYIPLSGNLTATNLLGKPLKSFIVNLADLPRKGVKRLATSDERVNHGSR
jgi:hypothetical protein